VMQSRHGQRSIGPEIAQHLLFEAQRTRRRLPPTELRCRAPPPRQSTTSGGSAVSPVCPALPMGYDLTPTTQWRGNELRELRRGQSRDRQVL
jgi:hypothetical protein